jgi:hypothetical protein
MLSKPRCRFRPLAIVAFIGTIWSLAPIPIFAQTLPLFFPNDRPPGRPVVRRGCLFVWLELNATQAVLFCGGSCSCMARSSLRSVCQLRQHRVKVK